MQAATILARRWHGHTPWPRLFWRDLLAIGTFANLLFGFVALMLLAQRVNTAWGMALHLLLLPCNLFLVACVWRHPDSRLAARAVASGWLLFTFLL